MQHLHILMIATPQPQHGEGIRHHLELIGLLDDDARFADIAITGDGNVNFGDILMLEVDE